MHWRLGTRGSRLALIQTESVRARLAAAYPEDTFETVIIKTTGDRLADRPLAALGTSAAFTAEIERALLADEIDLAVHSMKDLSALIPEGLSLAKAWPREDARDVLVARTARSLDDLPPGAVVATGSVRRSHFLRQRRPDLTLVEIRGNVDTRLRKLFDPQPDEPQLDAIVLAAAGLKRLGRTEVITETLDPAWMIPAPHQGQLALEVRAADCARKARLDALGDDAAQQAVEAEHAFLVSTGATCRDPVAAYARFVDNRLILTTFFQPETTD